MFIQLRYSDFSIPAHNFLNNDGDYIGYAVAADFKSPMKKISDEKSVFKSGIGLSFGYNKDLLTGMFFSTVELTKDKVVDSFRIIALLDNNGTSVSSSIVDEVSNYIVYNNYSIFIEAYISQVKFVFYYRGENYNV